MSDDPKPARGWTAKAIVAAVSATVGAVAGFLAGVATDQTNSYIARADDCYKSLAQYQVAVQAIPSYANSLADPSVGVQAHATAKVKWNTDVYGSYAAVVNTCPITNPGRDYLTKADTNEFVNAAAAMQQCAPQPPCSKDDFMGLVERDSTATTKLMDQANRVKDWTGFDRARYALTHFF